MVARERPSTGWLLTVLFVVLVAGYALLLLAILFIADLNNVDSLRGTAAFLLILGAVAFGALLFFGTTSAGGDDWEESEADVEGAETEAGVSVISEPPAEAERVAGCPNCGQVNPAGANFCNACGARLSPGQEGEIE